MNNILKACNLTTLAVFCTSVSSAHASPATQVAIDLRHYVDALNSAHPARQASPFVFGAKANAQTWERGWMNERAQASRRASNSPTGIEWRGVEGVRVQGEQAQATVKFYWFSQPRQETLQLKRRHTIGTVWQIVPHNAPQLAFAPTQPLEQAAFFLSRGSQAQPVANAKIEMRNLKNLTVNLFSNDSQSNDPLFTHKAVAAAQSKARKSGLLMASLRVGQTRDFYQFNSQLEGKRLTSINRPESTVLLYDGKEHRLRPRYNGKGVVAFADGHIELLTPQQLATKSW